MCITSRLTGLIDLPSFWIISESIGSGKRDGSGEDTPSGVGMFYAPSRQVDATEKGPTDAAGDAVINADQILNDDLAPGVVRHQ